VMALEGGGFANASMGAYSCAGTAMKGFTP
jgi:hypothetical protein